jgi:cytochrome c peroxidase
MERGYSEIIVVKRIVFLGLVLSFIFVGPAAGGSENDALMVRAKQSFGPLPAVMKSAENPVTPEKVKLGKTLFYEERISVDGTVSCAKSHPISHYGVDGLRVAVGNNCKLNPRNAPTVFNAADQISQHWIGNRKSVEDKAKQALTGPPSFGMLSYESVERRLREISGYGPLSRAAFPGDQEPVTADNFAKAVGAFERTLVTPPRFDAFLQGDAGALSEREKEGLKTFLDTGCMACHFGVHVGGQMYQRFGIFEHYWNYTKSKKIDEGRYALTKRESDKYVFKVPVLRNVAMAAPYFHDGSVDTLGKVVVIMAKIQLGKKIDSSKAETIVAFLDSLTGEIPEDAVMLPLLPLP